MFMFQVRENLSRTQWMVCYVDGPEMLIETTTHSEALARARCKAINDLPIDERRRWVQDEHRGYVFGALKPIIPIPVPGFFIPVGQQCKS